MPKKSMFLVVILIFILMSFASFASNGNQIVSAFDKAIKSGEDTVIGILNPIVVTAAIVFIVLYFAIKDPNVKKGFLVAFFGAVASIVILNIYPSAKTFLSNLGK